MKTSIVKNGMLAALLMGGLLFTSCKSKEADTEMDTEMGDTTDIDMVEPANPDTMSIETDTVTVNPDTIMGP